METLWSRLLCWWLGCVPDYDAVHYDSARDGWTDAVPCKRCGASDTTYGDRVGDTRKNRVAALLRHWLLAALVASAVSRMRAEGRQAL